MRKNDNEVVRRRGEEVGGGSEVWEENGVEWVGSGIFVERMYRIGDGEGRGVRSEDIWRRRLGRVGWMR